MDVDRQAWVERARSEVCRLLRPLRRDGRVTVSSVLPEVGTLGPMFHVFVMDDRGNRQAAFYLRWCDVHTAGKPIFGLDWTLEQEFPVDSDVWDDIPLELSWVANRFGS